jgi:hypothetical protein
MNYLIPLLNQVYPRILTQVNRDPHSTTYGCFDRNWWHYKIRDYPSIILQQGGYFLMELAQMETYKEHRESFLKLAKGTLDFWVERSLKKGAYEEYYPWEDGYPPLAFSTLAMAKIADQLNINSTELDRALKIAARKLQSRFESQAANQQIAGLAALSVIQKIRPAMVSPEKFEELSQKTLSLQDTEGWYMEYDGPDLGYLSVSLDCLWDLYDYTQDSRFLESAEKAAQFICDTVLFNQGPIGMNNARNTDYIVPYGLVRFVGYPNKTLSKSLNQLITLLYDSIEEPTHFFKAVDDRYWCHYIGHSVARAAQLLDSSKPIETEKHSSSSRTFPHAGYWMQQYKNHTLMVSAKKGGILTLKKDDFRYFDFGWLIHDQKKQYVTHWWDSSSKVEYREKEILISCPLVSHSDNNSNPFKHLALRVLSFTLGHHIINFLKNQLIFKNKKSVYTFQRSILLNEKESELQIADSILHLKGDEKIEKALRFSKRHVASADSFHTEDLARNRGYKENISIQNEKGVFKAFTTVSLK